VLGEFPAWVGGDARRGQERAVDALFGYLAARFPCKR
jgi:hypothetical protein